MNEELTEIICVLDRSGSMESIGLYPFVRVLCYAAFTTVCNSNCAGAKYPNVECSLTLL